ncbi:SDR family oxidoreductase [Jatrophihabitans telluris]|uniref:SDR family oxidoreductase n=1 Tax=Jatrophihabitans telluris TaxID=2038343 RepID=A0ABY4QS22_9ACTN|nr:SDR family oxidoreductase [Jatrophihabitans telluris]UQX86703.1 SDR family oxidoreductase [Jatrophihabitans telluris]
MPTGRFEGKVALITGASRGIGLAVAHRMVAEGARVCITARKLDALQSAATELGGPERAIFASGSGDDREHQAEAVARTVEAFGSLDVLVNNTGINPAFGPLLGLDEGVARKIFEVNVLSALSWVKLAHQAWMGEHGGSVVNVASVAGLGPAPGIAFYGVTKAALIALTKQLSFELAPGIRVNAVAPAVVKTRFAEALYADDEEAAAAGYLLKRLGEPEDIAAAVSYLASDDAAWTTGQTLVVDGGMLGSL